MRLRTAPITLRQASGFIDDHHRHHESPQGGMVAIALLRGEELVGVAVGGRPVSRALDDGLTFEITRVCVIEGVRNGCSMLYGRMRRIAHAIGYRRVISYTLASEPGTSLRAAGFRPSGTVRGAAWSRPSRPRRDHPKQDKLRWESDC